MSGQLLGGVIGAAIGFVVGGPAGAAYGWEAGAIAGSLLFPGKLPDGPRLSDLNPQTSVYGRPIPIIYGTMATSGNVIWASKLIETKHEQGGKGTPSQATFTYAANFAVALCEGVQSVGRIWAGPERRLIWDGAKLESGLLRIYPGDENQLPDPLIESYLGAAFTPAYRGTCYLVFENFQLGNDFNAIPVILAEVGTSPQFGTPPALHTVGLGILSAIDPLTGYVWAVGQAPANVTINGYNYLNGKYYITIIDPVAETIVYVISNFAGTNDFPRGICYNPYLQAFHIGNDSPPALATHQYGWTVNPLTYNIYTELGFYNPLTVGSFQVFTGLVTAGNLNVNLWQTNGASSIAFSQGYNNLILSDGYTKGVNNYGMSSAPSGAIWAQTADIADDYSIVVLRVYNNDLIVFNQNTQSIGVNLPSFGSGNLLVAWSTVDLCFYGYRTDTAAMYQITGSAVTFITFIDWTTNSIGSNLNYLGATLPGNNIFPSALCFDSERNSLWMTTTGYGSIGNLYEVNIPSYSGLNFTIKQTILNQGPTGGPTPPGALLRRVPNANKLIGWNYTGNTVVIIPFGQPVTVSPTSVTLASIVSDLSVRAGLTTGQIDVTQLTDLVDGYALTRQMNVRAAIDALRQIYFFDAVESMAKVKYVKRGSYSGVTILDSDLAAHPQGQGVPDPLLSVRQMEVELPKFVDVKYQLAVTNYQPASKQAKRLTGQSQNVTTIDLPLVLQDLKAQNVAEVNLYVAWQQRLTYQFSAPKKYCYLEPTDVITVKSHVMRVEKVTMTPNGILNFEATQDDPNLYTPRSGVVATSQIVQTVYFAPVTQVVIMDINMLQDSDNDPGFYAAACGALGSTGWKGANLYVSADSGASYTVCGTFEKQATIGNITNVLGTFSAGDIPDETNSIIVKMVYGTFSSTDYAGLINGNLTVVVGREIINYRTATLNGDGTYTLTGLLRGRRGTENYMGNHVVNEFVVLISTTTLIRVNNQPSDIGLNKLYKPVTIQGSLAGTISVAAVNNAHSLWPYAPVQLGGGFDGSNNATLTWVRRGRIAGDWRDSVDVPLSEETEQYTVTIWDSTFTTLKRTISSITSQSVAYTAAQQTTDFGSTQSTIYFHVGQISAITGIGYLSQGTAPASTTTFI